MIGIAAKNENVDRTVRVLLAWAATPPKETGEGLTVKQAIKAIDEQFLVQYGGFSAAGRRLAELKRLPEAKVAEGVKIDECSTYRATRFAVPV